MNCSKCNSPLGAGQFCANCGLKHEYIKKACNTADVYYNKGLSKAEARDLYGAKKALEKALFYNKKHTDARNLLGLVEFETGEVMEAEKQWKISLEFQKVNNHAQRYLDEISEGNYQESLKQIIKKYNLAIQYAQQGSEDLALIQAKKVISMMPNFVNAHLLLALLNAHAGRNEEALENVKNVLKMDRFNPTAVRYYQEISGEVPVLFGEKEKEEDETQEDKRIRMPELGKYIEPSKSNSNMMISLIIGIVIGIVVMWVLIMPNQKFNVSSDYKALQTEFKDTVGAKDATITELEEDKAALLKENKTLSGRLEVYAGKDGKDGMYDSILKATSLYMSGDTIGAAKALLNVDEARLESKTAKEMYTKIKDNTFAAASDALYNEGKKQYDGYRYEDAKALLKDAYDLNKENYNALYFLGRCYQRLGANKKAIDTYKKVINKFPDSERASEAVKKLAELGVVVEDPNADTTAEEEVTDITDTDPVTEPDMEPDTDLQNTIEE